MGRSPRRVAGRLYRILQRPRVNAPLSSHGRLSASGNGLVLYRVANGMRREKRKSYSDTQLRHCGAWSCWWCWFWCLHTTGQECSGVIDHRSPVRNSITLYLLPVLFDGSLAGARLFIVGPLVKDGLFLSFPVIGAQFVLVFNSRHTNQATPNRLNIAFHVRTRRCGMSRLMPP